ncbi:MAG: TrbI/VirB10 family protein [Alphaproteobacteria bacterium]|nr:TrbI/VirB10 family protein [Alphaproteobacteria bacterium]
MTGGKDSWWPGHGETEAPPPGPDGAGAAPPKGDPADFELRVQPRGVTRINRRVLAVLAGVGVLAVLGIFSFALAPPDRHEGATAPEIRVPGRPRLEAVEQLPATYQDMAFTVPGAAAAAVNPEKPETEGTVPAHADAEAAARRREAERATDAMRSELFFSVRGSAPVPPPPPAPAGPGAGPDFASVTEPDAQDRRQAFLEAGPSADIYNPHLLEEPLSPWQVMAGSVLRAALVTGLNSDLPGFVVAQLTEHVFDSVTGTVVLLPRGTRLLGRYDSGVAFGQERALVVWQRLILPDGASVVVENLPAADEAGYAGLSDTVDIHGWQLARGILLSSLLGVGTELAWKDEGDVTRAFRESVQDGTDKAAGALVQRELDVQPTLRVRPGWPLTVLVHRDLVLRPWRGPSGP